MRRIVAVMGAVASLLVASPALAAEGMLPIEHFTRADEFGSLKISPDGQFLAATLGRNGRSVLAFIDLKDHKIVSGIRTRERREIYDYDWISPTRVIYQIAERQPGNAYLTPTGEIAAVDRDGRAHRFLYGYRAGEMTTGTRLAKREASYAHAELLSTLKGDDKHILIAEYPWKLMGNMWFHDRDGHPLITRLNVYDGRKRTIGGAPLAAAELLVDRNDHVRFALGFGAEGHLTVSWKPDPDGDWQAFELPGFREDSVRPLFFSADNATVFFTGVRSEEVLQALFRLDLATHAVEKIYEHESVDVDDVVTDLTGEHVIGVRTYTSRPEYHWFKEDDKTARIYAALKRAFPDHAVEITSATDDGRIAAVFVYSDVNPGDYYLFETQTMHADYLQTMHADYLQAGRAWIDPQDMQHKEPVRIEARDGLTLHGYLTRRRDASAPHPMILLPHGGPFGVRDTWGFDWEVQLLASRGYAVLQVNFRGSGGYGMAFEAAGYREWGGRMQDDLTDATRWAIEENIADPQRICIVGASYGGYAALMGTAREPGLYRCAIGYAGVYDLELMYSSGDISRSRIGRSYLQSNLGSEAQALRQRSPVHLAAQIDVPVLLVHGSEDWRVDYEHAKRMKAALEKHGKPVEWLALPGEGHGIYDESTRQEVYEKMLSFLARHMTVGSASAASAEQ